MASRLRRAVRKVGKVAGAVAAVYFGAPYLLAAGGTVISGAVSALGPALASRALGGGGGQAPPEPQASGGQQFFIGGGGFGPSGGAVGYSDIGAGGAGAAILPGGPFDAPGAGGAGISPGLLLGIAGGGLALTVLFMLLRR